MTDADERAAARAELEREVQSSSDPTLDANDIEMCLDRARVAKVWAAETAYAYGDKVVPASPRDRYYRCVEPGTSGTTEPTFPVYDSGQVADGTATWEEAGYFGGKLYDVRAAIHAGAGLKKKKLAPRMAFSADGRSFQAQQQFEHWERIERQYASVGIA